MEYKKIRTATFLRRPNRFIAEVMLDGKIETVHVANTGRCKELLLPDAVVYLSESDNARRKTRYDLVTVEKIIPTLQGSKKVPVNLDSLAPNKAAAQWIKSNSRRYPQITTFRPEYTMGNSRFDFYVEYRDAAGFLHKQPVEVKGCTLEKNGVAMFPDAPTLRGLKHVEELTKLQQSGEYNCLILIVVQMDCCHCFAPNRETHPEFAQALKCAAQAGVEIKAIQCTVTPSSLIAGDEIPCILS